MAERVKKIADDMPDCLPLPDKHEDIPLNQNGKLNKKALPLPEIHESTKEYVEPSNEVEAELARGFAVALGMNKLDTRMFNIRIFEITETDESISKDFYFDFLHPIIDGDSMEIFLQDINSAYHGKELEPEKYSIFDYYDLIEDIMQSEGYLKEQEWNQKFTRSFTEHLNELPGDLDPKDENKTKPLIVPLKINLEAVDKFTKSQGITDGTLLSAAFGLLQGHSNGEQAGVALTFYNGRDDIRFERTIGAIYRHYPLCVRWSTEMSAETFVKETQENILLCRRHALYEGDSVPIIISFAYQGEYIDGDFEFCGGKAKYEEFEDYEEENFNFYIHRRADDFYVDLTYNTKEYSDDFVKKFMENYAKAVNELASGKKPADIEAEFDYDCR